MTTPTRKHRAGDRIAALEQQVENLTAALAAHEDAAGRLNESILRGIQDATALVEARALIEELRASAARMVVQHERELRDLRDQNARLRAERVDAGSLRQQLDTAEAHIRQISAENLAMRADIANRDAVDVPPMHRDIDPNDQATTPIDVTRLRRSYKVQKLADALGGAA